MISSAVVFHMADPPSRTTFAFYLYRNGQVLDKTGYARETEKTYRDLAPGRYQVKYFVRTGEKAKQSFIMDEIAIWE